MGIEHFIHSYLGEEQETELQRQFKSNEVTDTGIL